MSLLRRNYSITDPELGMFVTNLVGFITRDQAEFIPRGVTLEMVTALKTLGGDFENFPIDDYFLADNLIAQENKTATRNSLFAKMRTILGYAKIHWGPNSTQVKQFDAGKMTMMDDKKLLSTCRLAVNIAGDCLAELSSIGLTEAMIADLDAACQTFEENLNAITTARVTRDIKTQERIRKGNEIYSLVQRYCLIGKIIWEDVNVAKYKNYVIYDESFQKRKKPKKLAGDDSSEIAVPIKE